MWHTASTEPSCDATSCCLPRVMHQRHQANLLQTCPHSRGCRVSLLYKTNPSKELPLAFWVLNASGQGFQLYTRGAVKGLALMGGSDQSTTTTITSNSVTIPTFSCQTLHLAHPHSQHTPALVLPLHPGMPFKHKSDPFDFLFFPPQFGRGGDDYNRQGHTLTTGGCKREKRRQGQLLRKRGAGTYCGRVAFSHLHNCNNNNKK